MPYNLPLHLTEGGVIVSRSKSPAKKVRREETEPALRAAIYCRKSDDDGKGGGDGSSLSVKIQELDCRRIIELEGWEPVTVYADDGISGRTWPTGKDYDALSTSDTLTNEYIKNMSKKRRPGLGALLDSIKRREVDVIVVRDMPRLARPVFKSALQNFLPSFIQSNRVRIHSLADGMIDYDDFGKSLALFLADALLDKELKTRAKHSKEARHRERSSGRYLTSAPFGYVWDTNRKLVQEPESAAILKSFYEQSVKGLSTTSIARKANACGSKSPSGKKWFYNTIRRMLMNPLYMGKINVDGRLIKCIDVDDPIISEQVYFKVLRQFESRMGIKSNRAKSTGGLASGIARCGLCGYAMFHHHATAGDVYKRYTCSMKTSFECRCSLSANNLDEFLTYFISLKSILEHRQVIKDAEEKSQLPELLEKANVLNDKIAKYEERILIEDMDIFVDVFKRMKTDLLKVQQRIADLENIPEAPAKDIWIKHHFTEEANLPIEEKRDAIRMVFKTVKVFPDRVEFELVSGESFTVKRIDLGRRRVYLPPASFKFEHPGEFLQITMTHGIEKSLDLLDGRLKIMKLKVPGGEKAEREALTELLEAKRKAAKMAKKATLVDE